MEEVHYPPNPDLAQHHPPTHPVSRSWSLRADDLTGPSLMFRPWVQMCDLHLHRLNLQVLRRDPAHFVRDLVALNWDILPLDTGKDSD